MKGHLTIPSPVSEISTNWISEHNSNILLKRDDLIHPIISGNKWRKLSGILAKNSWPQSIDDQIARADWG